MCSSKFALFIKLALIEKKNYKVLERNYSDFTSGFGQLNKLFVSQI